MCAAKGRTPRPSGDEAEQQDAAAGQPDAALPPCRRQRRPTPPIISIAGKVPSPNASHGEEAGSAPAVLAACATKA